MLYQVRASETVSLSLVYQGFIETVKGHKGEVTFEAVGSCGASLRQHRQNHLVSEQEFADNPVSTAVLPGAPRTWP